MKSMNYDNEDENEKEELKIDLAPSTKSKLLKRGVSSEFDVSKLIKKRTVASSLVLNRAVSIKDGGQAHNEGSASNLKKNKTLNIDIYRKLKTEQEQMMN